MTPDQKEAFRREVLEEAAGVTDTLAYDAFDAYAPRSHELLEVASARIRALAASHPAPNRERSNHHVRRGMESIPCFCWADGDHRIGEEVDAPAADTGQAVFDLGEYPDLPDDTGVSLRITTGAYAGDEIDTSTLGALRAALRQKEGEA